MDGSGHFRHLWVAYLAAAVFAAVGAVLVLVAMGQAEAEIGSPEVRTSSQCVVRGISGTLRCDEAGGQDPGGADAVLRVGDDFQQVIAAHPPGSTFRIEAGLHRLQSVVPRDGDRFVGQSGAVLSGAKVLTPGAAKRDSQGRWYWDGQTQRTSTSGNYGCTDWSAGNHHYAECGHEREVFHGEELFVTTRAGDPPRRLRHVNALAQVSAPGHWFFDYNANRIYLYDDPAGFALVETTAKTAAFEGPGVDGVVIENLVVRQYGSRAQRGAIDGTDTTNWTVRNVEASHNHGMGIKIGPGWRVENSRIVQNGQLGIGGRGDRPVTLPVVVDSNEIAHNGVLGFQPGWEHGGTKFVRTTGLVFRNNWVHRNRSKGFWADISNRGGTVASNRVERNGTVGIFWEIGFDARIYWNEVYDNHTTGDMKRSFGSIQVVASDGVQVYENLVRGGSNQEIMANHQDRGESRLRNLVVRDNDVTLDSSWGGGLVGLKNNRGSGDPWSASANNRFSGNTYRIAPSASSKPFFWDGATRSAAEWLLAHPTDRVLTTTAAGRLPSGATAFRVAQYGPR